MEPAATDNPIELARNRLLVPTGLEDSHLDAALGKLLTGGVDFADIYFQFVRNESWSLEDGMVTEGSHSIDQGVGVRAMAGDKTGFAYSDETHGAGAHVCSGRGKCNCAFRPDRSDAGVAGAFRSGFVSAAGPAHHTE